MKKILVVFTGGTIGSTADAESIKVDQGKAFALISSYQKRYPDALFSFTAIEPLTILSENLHPRDWTTLIVAIEAAAYQEFDGIIITHGTDTLAITASILSLYFHAITRPMLIVSSHLPLDDPRNNGKDHFDAALSFIEENIAPGVYVPYRNPDESGVTFYYGARIAMSLQLSSDFYSVGAPFARYDNGRFTAIGKRGPLPEAYPLKPIFAEEILYLKPYPGINYDRFRLDGVQCVLHDLYHSGTAATQPLLAFIQRCKDKAVPIYLSPLKTAAGRYESSALLQRSHAMFLYDISIEASLAKLYLAYGNFTTESEIKTFLQTPLDHEFLDS